MHMSNTHAHRNSRSRIFATVVRISVTVARIFVTVVRIFVTVGRIIVTVVRIFVTVVNLHISDRSSIPTDHDLDLSLIHI